MGTLISTMLPYGGVHDRLDDHAGGLDGPGTPARDRGAARVPAARLRRPAASRQIRRVRPRAVAPSRLVAPREVLDRAVLSLPVGPRMGVETGTAWPSRDRPMTMGSARGPGGAVPLGYSPRAMSSQTKRIAVLTGGGDCPGLNAVIRVVTLEALAAGIKVVGIEDGFEGLVKGRIRPLGLQEVTGILDEGGTILGSSNRCDPSRYLVGHDGEGPRLRGPRAPVLERIESEGIDALVVIGGTGP